MAFTLADNLTLDYFLSDEMRKEWREALADDGKNVEEHDETVIHIHRVQYEYKGKFFKTDIPQYLGFGHAHSGGWVEHTHPITLTVDAVTPFRR